MIQGIYQLGEQVIAPLEQVGGRFSASIPRVAFNLSKVALPVIALVALASIPGASAGPASYGTCVACCLALATPVAMPACLVGCVALSGPWCP